jgi:hypothetical protein
MEILYCSVLKLRIVISIYFNMVSTMHPQNTQQIRPTHVDFGVNNKLLKVI